jgi:hypothetical protein
MKPDLRNVLIVTEVKDAQRPKIGARHRAFPELRGEGSSPREALVAVLGFLKRATGWAEDNWHNVELSRAIFDVEAMLKLLVSTDGMRISGQHCTIRRIADLVYLTNHTVEPGSTEPGCRGSFETTETEESTGNVLIYLVGRRYGDRRWPNAGTGPRAVEHERRRFQRRSADRRQFNRLRFVDSVENL